MELTEEQLQHLVEGILACMVCLVEDNSMIEGRDAEWALRALELFGPAIVSPRPIEDQLQ